MKKSVSVKGKMKAKPKAKAKAKAVGAKLKAKMKAGAKSKSRIQGEGDYEAARRYRKRTRKYLENNDVEKAAIRARPTTSREARALQAAEAAGKKRAKGEDPAFRRRAAPRVEPSTRARTSRQ